MKVNVASQRDDAIRMFIAQAEKDLANGYRVIVGGDFNEPSHRDWIEKIRTCTTTTALLYPGQLPLCWKKLALLTATVRFIPILTHPGFTYPSDNLAKTPEKITWAPKADERDRIDFYLL